MQQGPLKFARITTDDTEDFRGVREDIRSIYEGNISKSLGTVGGAMFFLYSIMFFTIAVLSLVVIGTHIENVRVETVCTDTNVPARCWAGSAFRAMNFTALSKTVTYDPLTAGMYVGVDDTNTWSTLHHFPVLVNGDLETAKHLSSRCAIDLPENYTAEHLTACEVTNVQPLWEVPNHIGYSTLSGGVHVVFFIWLALHITASFLLIMVPLHPQLKTYQKGKDEPMSAITGQSVKQVIFIFWHCLGILLPVIIYANDHYFNMRLPLNNVIHSTALQLFAVFIQYSWTIVTETEQDILSANGNGGAMQDMVRGEDENHHHHHGHHDGNTNTEQRMALMNAMAISKGGAVKLGSGREMRYNVGGKDDVEYDNDWNVMETKLVLMETFETVMTQCALTLPLLMVAVMCIGHRVQVDYLLQSVYLRTFLLFATFALSERISAIARRDYIKDMIITDATVMIQFLFLGACTVLFAFLIIDWYEPFRLTNAEYRKTGNLSTSYNIVLATTGFFSFIIFFVWIYKVVQTMPTITDKSKRIMEVRFIVGVSLLVQLLVCILCITLGIYATNPKSWYSAYNEQDVLLNYS